MTSKGKGKLKCEPDAEVAGSSKSSESLENTIKPSEEFLQLFKTSYALSKAKKFDKKLIKTIETKMKKLYHRVSKSTNAKLDDIIALAFTYNHVSRTYFDTSEREHLDAAKEFIMCAINLIKDKEVDPRIILLAQKSYCNLGLIYNAIQKKMNAAQAYDKALGLWLTYKMQKGDDSHPVDYESTFSSSPEPNSYVKMEEWYLFILHSLNDLHTDMGNHQHLIVTNHLLLTHELNQLHVTKEYEKWVEKVTELSGCLIRYNRFREAKNYINTALYVKQMYLVEQYINFQADRSAFFMSEEYKRATVIFNSLNLYQIKYNVALLRRSAEHRLRLEEDEDFETDSSTRKSSSKSKKQTPQTPQRLMMFSLIKEDDVKEGMTQQITVQRIRNYSDANRTFCYTLNLLYKYEIRHPPAEDIKGYMQCVLSISNAYKYMALYEKDATNRYLMRERRVDILFDTTHVVADCNYQDESRYLSLQRAIASSILIDMKLDDIEPSPLPHMLEKHYRVVDEISILVARSLFALRKYRS